MCSAPWKPLLFLATTKRRSFVVKIDTWISYKFLYTVNFSEVYIGVKKHVRSWRHFCFLNIVEVTISWRFKNITPVPVWHRKYYRIENSEVTSFKFFVPKLDDEPWWVCRVEDDTYRVIWYRLLCIYMLDNVFQ